MTGDMGSRPLRVAVVGSGPAGFYAARALLSQQEVPAEVDMFDRLPTPYGLVRGGVAPDHQKIKNVVRVYDKTAALPGFRFFGNVTFGRDLSLADVRQHYDHLILAVGNESDRRLGIPGEGMRRSTPASVFVGWYNGHPDFQHWLMDLSVRRVAVVGNGNVAVDVARILASSPELLRQTDIASYALDALSASQVREVVLLGRRGPLQAAFSPGELKELGELDGVDLVIDPAALEPAQLGPAAAAAPSDHALKNLELLRRYAERPRRFERSIEMRFLVSPEEIIANESGAVCGLRLRHNRLELGPDGWLRATAFETVEELRVEMVVPAVGYRGRPLPDVPFDERRGIIPNESGKVLLAGGAMMERTWVVGWARSGPQGLIGAHKAASAEVVGRLLAEVQVDGELSRPLPPATATDELLRARSVPFVTFDQWQRLNAVEVERGQRRDAPRDKVSSVNEMLEVMGEPQGDA